MERNIAARLNLYKLKFNFQAKDIKCIWNRKKSRGPEDHCSHHYRTLLIYCGKFLPYREIHSQNLVHMCTACLLATPGLLHPCLNNTIHPPGLFCGKASWLCLALCPSPTPQCHMIGDIMCPVLFGSSVSFLISPYGICCDKRPVMH